MVFCAVSVFAQAPQKFTYQAVVRNANNMLVVNAPVGVRVSILQGGVNGTLVYMETQTPFTNANGLITLQIGGGNVQQGNFADIDWSGGSYFLKTETDPDGGSNYSLTSTQQLLSVPYALYAKEAANGFSGDYNDLTNTPQIPQIPADVSAFNNDAGYITGYSETDPTVPAWAKEPNKPTYSYSEIVNTPTIPTVPTNVSVFTNDAGYLTGNTETDPTVPVWAKEPNKPTYNYSEIVNTPSIPTVPTNVSAFTNDAGYITAAQVPAQVNADWNATSGAAQILNKPTLFSGNYNDLTNKPNLFSGSYNDLTNKPNLSAVAYSGSYNDLTNKPSIPTVVGELTNNVGYITAAQVPAQVNADWNAASGAAQILNKPTLFSGDYNDLTNKPTIPTVPFNVSAFSNDAGYITAQDIPAIPTVPTNVSVFTNDAGYLTGYTETDPQFNAWDKSYNDLTNKPVLFSGDYNDLANKPTIPTVPANVSAFTNDAGYLTEYIEQQVLSISNDTISLTGGSFVKLPAAAVGFSGDYNDLTNKPTIPTVPTNVSAFTNDAGYLTAADIQQTVFVPTQVSAFQNDAHYITQAQLNALLAPMYNTIDSLRSRIEELENGGDHVTPDTVNIDTTTYSPVYIDGMACPGAATVTDWDGNVYNTVAIGQQCWLKENLRSMHYADGTAIPLSEGSQSQTAPFYYVNIDLDASVYGYLYNWPAVMCGSYSSSSNPSNVRGICPNGWHVPSDAEWAQLYNYLSGQEQYWCDINSNSFGKALASKIGWINVTNFCAVGNGPNSNNATGFSAAPAGFYSSGHQHVGRYANFASATQVTVDNIWYRSIDTYGSSMLRYQVNKSHGCSVRCLRD